MANVNEVYTADGEELINLTKDTVSEISLLSGATAHDASGAQIVGKAQYINPNLIINSNLKINQRGQTEYVGGTLYTVDNWKLITSNDNCQKKVTVLSDGVEISTIAGAGNGYFADYTQIFETFLDYGTYAISAIIDGEYRTCTGTLSDDTTPIYDGVFILYRDCFQIRCTDATRTIKNVKLEPGLIATPYVDPDEALELVKCQRCYREITGMFPITIMSSSLVCCDIPIGNMRVTPTAFFKTDVFDIDSGVRVVDNLGAPIIGFTFTTVVATNTKSVRIGATKEGHDLSRNDALICVDINNPVCLSAEP